MRELVDAVTRYTDAREGEGPFTTPIPDFIVLRSDEAKHVSHILFQPALCMVLQGAKWTSFGGRRFDYPAGRGLVVSVETPGSSEASGGGPDRPFLGLAVGLDPGIVREVLERLPAPPAPERRSREGIFVVDCEGPLTDCALRAMRLLDTPEAIPHLYPGILEEICYRLLVGPHGAEVAKMTLANPHAQRIVRAVHLLRERFAEPMRIEALAEVAQLSPSAFHRQFKALTSMTPLQYQKQLRLLEARRLMLSDDMRAERAAFLVGYESASQFSREYARMFGMPPRRDVVSLQRAAG